MYIQKRHSELRDSHPKCWSRKITIPSFSSSFSSLWEPAQLCGHAPARWGWPRTRLSAATGRRDACPSFGRWVYDSLLHLQPGTRYTERLGSLHHSEKLQILPSAGFGCHWCDTYHQPPHSLLLYALILFLLLALSVGMIGGDSFGGLLDLRCDGAMVLLKVLGVLQDAVEVFLLVERSTLSSL